MANSRRAPQNDVRRSRPDDERPARPRGNDRDDEGDDDEGPEMPRKKRKSAAGPVKLILRITAGVIGAILLILLLWWVYTPIGTDYALLCYFPPETVRLEGYEVDEGSKIAKLKDVHETLINNYKDFGDRRFSSDAGVTYGDVDKFLTGHAAGNPEEEKDLPPDSPDRRGSLTVVRFKKSINEQQFVDSFKGAYRADARTRDGKNYYQLQRYQTVSAGGQQHQELKDDISFFFPKSNILVYASTRRELVEAMSRAPGKVVLTGHIREIADKVDGIYFSGNTGFLSTPGFAGSNTMAFGLGFIDQEVREQTAASGIAGTASWFASNGTDFLYASGTLYGDNATAKRMSTKLKESFYKAQKDIFQGDSGTPAGLTDPFNPKQPAQPGGMAGGFGGGGGNQEQSRDIIDALAHYARNARVYSRGRMVVIEGTIPHGMPEQGVFEKFWAAAGNKFRKQSQGGGFGPPGMPGMPPGGGPGVGGFPAPPGPPVGPGPGR